MKQVLTAKLKLVATPKQAEMLREASLAYRDALNYTSLVAFNNKMSSAAKLQKLVYYDIRDKYKLPSQMACNVPRQVAATYKGLCTKLMQNIAAIEQGLTKKRYKGLDKPPKYISRTCNLNYLRDFSFTLAQQVSIITLQGRIKVPYQGYNFHLHLIKQATVAAGVKIGTAKIWYAKSTKTYYLLVSIELDLPEFSAKDVKHIVGVDVGRRYLAVTTDTQNRTKFYSGKQAIHQAFRYQRARKSLQRKGTRSATKRLVALSVRERRFTADRNHCIAKAIVVPNSLIGLENLTHIRERTNPKKKGSIASKKQSQANRNQAKWSFVDLHTFIDYKAAMNRSLAIKIDADYTSQSCPCCGHTSKENRPKKGKLFICLQCGFELHADLVGARNITLRVLLSRQDWERTGRVSAVPDVSDFEAKAARLSRYAELRWSLDAIPKLIFD